MSTSIHRVYASHLQEAVKLPVHSFYADIDARDVTVKAGCVVRKEMDPKCRIQKTDVNLSSFNAEFCFVFLTKCKK